MCVTRCKRTHTLTNSRVQFGWMVWRVYEYIDVLCCLPSNIVMWIAVLWIVIVVSSMLHATIYATRIYIHTHTHTHTHCAHINTSSIKCYEYNQSACSSNNTNNPACFAHTSYLLPNAFRLLSLSLSLALLVPSDDLFVISSFVALYATAQTAIGTLSSAQRCC